MGQFMIDTKITHRGRMMHICFRYLCRYWFRERWPQIITWRNVIWLLIGLLKGKLRLNWNQNATKKHQSSASLALVRGIHRWPVYSPHKGPVTRKMFPFDDVIMVNWPFVIFGCRDTRGWYGNRWICTCMINICYSYCALENIIYN